MEVVVRSIHNLLNDRSRGRRASGDAVRSGDSCLKIRSYTSGHSADTRHSSAKYHLLLVSVDRSTERKSKAAIIWKAMKSFGELRTPEEIIENLNTDMQRLTKNLHCQICMDLLSEPYALSCGHTFCYYCSFEWLKSHKSCPTCRAKISQPPTFVFAIKEMCQVVIERKELLDPHGEGHQARTRQIEQEALVKSHHPIFPGLFSDVTRMNLNGGRIDDPEDHVLRCIRCHWEVEGPFCVHCGYQFSDTEEIHVAGSESEESELEVADNEYDLEDSFIDTRLTSEIGSQESGSDSFLDDGEDTNLEHDVDDYEEGSQDDERPRASRIRLSPISLSSREGASDIDDQIVVESHWQTAEHSATSSRHDLERHPIDLSDTEESMHSMDSGDSSDTDNYAEKHDLTMGEQGLNENGSSSARSRVFRSGRSGRTATRIVLDSDDDG